MKTAIFIPARMDAKRLPNKPMADIAGLPMIVQVWKRAVAANIGPVFVACDHEDIANIIRQHGGQAILTDPHLPSGSDRIWAAFQHLENKERYEYIVNVQGDLPDFEPDLIKDTLEPFKDPDVDIATVATLMSHSKEIHNPNVVKIALSLWPQENIGRALYFSRASIPAGEGDFYHHIGIYAYRPHALERFVSLPSSPLEKRESLEQLRALEAGMRIDVKLVNSFPLSVDTPEDLDKVRTLWEPFLPPSPCYPAIA